MRNSGKLLILAMVGVGLAAAAASWWFRYAATHRAAEFWGPIATRLIRDAPVIMLEKSGQDVADGGSATFDVSKAPGMTHLRNALLEDRSFDWMSSNGANESIQTRYDGSTLWSLTFSDPARGESFAVEFSDECRRGRQQVGGDRQSPRYFSTVPIAEGLVEMFRELSAEPAVSER